jgi:hypothetical protein
MNKSRVKQMPVKHSHSRRPLLLPAPSADPLAEMEARIEARIAAKWQAPVDYEVALDLIRAEHAKLWESIRELYRRRRSRFRF